MSAQSSEDKSVLDDEYPMILIGRDHRVSYANLRAHQLFGYEHGELHGMSIELLLAPGRRSEVRNVQAVLNGQGTRRWRSSARHAKGALLDVNLAIEPCIDHRGSVVAVKLRCERLIRSRPPTSATFDAVSGTRPIPQNSKTPSAPSATSELILTDDGAAQLETALQLLVWLRHHVEAANEPIDDARERARMLVVLGEVTELVALCRSESKREPAATRRLG